ncbi:hypothetical protein Bbelb_351080 [Branchiostoma belcheri]|nr:hypothetical protein Bbelb_351080 [Branchiostoma belcheri]
MTEASSTYEKLNKEQMERNCHVLAEVKKLRLAAGLKESAGISVESDVGYNNPPKGRVCEGRRRKGLPKGPGSHDGCTQTFDRNLKMGNSEGKMAKNAGAVIRSSGLPIEDLCGDNDGKILNGTNEKQSLPSGPRGVFKEGRTRRTQEGKQAIIPTRDALQGLIDYRLAENAVYNTDRGTPGFQALVQDSWLANNHIQVDLGQHKNVNKNPVAERAIEEVREELRKADPFGQQVSSAQLAVITAQLNAKVRSNGLSSREFLFQRDQFCGKQIPISDKLLLEDQNKRRIDNHTPSARSKVPTRKTKVTPSISLLDPAVLQRYQPLSVEADDNCFYRAISRVLYGHELAHPFLRLLTTMEIAEHRSIYDREAEDAIDLIEDEMLRDEDYSVVLRHAVHVRLGRYASFHYMLAMSSVLGTPFESYCPPTEHEHAFSAPFTRDVRGRNVGKDDRPTFKIIQHIRDTAPVADDAPMDTVPQNTAPVADDAPMDTVPQNTAPVADDAPMDTVPPNTAPVADDAPMDTAPQNTAPVADDAPMDTAPQNTAPVADDAPVVTAPQNTAPVADDAPVVTAPQAKCQSSRKTLMDKVLDVIDTVMGRHRLMIGQEMEAILQYIRPCLKEKCFLANHQYRQEPHRHLVFGGPAGTGKTSVAKAFAEFINNMKRRMRDAMKEDTGKVILVDEIYQLGSKTSSSIIIMAGYLQQIEDKIFSLNEGFRGRFPDTVHFLPLTVQQLTDILEQKIKLSGYTISDYSKEMETAIGNIPMEVRSRHNARLVNQLIVNANTGQDETTLTRPSTLLTHRGAEGHLAVKLIDFGSACWEYYPCSFDVREEMSSHIAPEVMKGAPHLPRHKMRHDTLQNQITKYIQHTSKEDEMEDITAMEKTGHTDVEVEQLLDQWMKGTSAHRRIHPMMDGWEAFQRDMAILAFFERPISMCVLSGWMGGLPERHGRPGPLRATHQYVCLVRMDGRPSRETWPSWPSSGDPSVCVSCQDGWEAFQRDMAILAFFERPISMCVLSGWMGGLPERHGRPGLLRATHQYVCVRMDGRPSRETWPSWPSSGDPSVCVSCQDGWEAFQRDMAILAFFERPISMCVSGWMGGLPERHGRPGLLRATHQYVCLVRMDGRPSRGTWPSWPSSSDPSICVSCQDGWEAFRRDMSILSFFERFFDDTLRGGVARIMYDAYVILMNQGNDVRKAFGRISCPDWQAAASLFLGAKGYGQQEDAHEFLTDVIFPTFKQIECVVDRQAGTGCVPGRRISIILPELQYFKPNLGELFCAPRRFHVGKVLKSDIEEQEVQVQFYKPARKNLLVNFGAPEWVTPKFVLDTSVDLSKDGVTLLPPSKMLQSQESLGGPEDFIHTNENTDEPTRENTDESTRENTNESTRENTNESTRENTDESTRENTNESTRHNTDESTRHNTDESTRENTNESTRHNTNESTRHNTDESTRHNTDKSTRENTDNSTRENTDKSTRHNTDESTRHNTDESTRENTDQSTRENTDKSTRHNTDESTRHNTDESTRHNTNKSTRHNTDESTRHNTDKSTRHNTDESTRENTDKSTRHNTDKSTRHNTDKSTRHNTDESTQENTDESTRENTDKSTRHNTDKSTRHNTDKSTRHNTDKSTRHNTDKSTRHNTDKSTRENTDESTRENTDESTRENTDKSTRENTDKSTRENTDEPTQQNTDKSTQKNTDEPTRENTDVPTQQNTDGPK